MQPVLVITSAVPGLIWVNGRAAGEVEGESAVVLPVSPQGPVYLQHWPALPGYLPLTRRVTFSGGRLLPGSVEDMEGLSAVIWPGGAVDVELSPERVGEEKPAPFSPLDQPGAARMEDGTVRTLTPINDTVGHVRLDTWHLEEGEWRIAYTEVMWGQGGPRWPDTPERTALAMIEACLLGLTDEARGYLTPSARLIPFEGIGACVPMRFSLPDGRPAVGLVRLENQNLARIIPLYYHAVPTGGTQGTWRIDDISVETSLAY